MNFPISLPHLCRAPPAALASALYKQPFRVWVAEDYLAVFAAMQSLDLRGVIASALGNSCDFVSRFFGPKLGISEDTVTGSAHCKLAPLWAEKLGKTLLAARQLST